MDAVEAGSPALFTDHYELTAARSALASGVADRRSTFEVFARRLPEGRRYGVVAGVGRIARALDGFGFRRSELDHLLADGVIDNALADRLDGWTFQGSIDTYREGDLYFPNSPVLTLTGTFADALLLETLILSILNHDSAVASAAARMHDAASGRTLIEAGSRRIHEESAVAAARAAYLTGFDVTSNLEAGRRWGVPTGGTTMHAFVLAHRSERAAFDAQIDTFGCGTTFLVDTYDTLDGVRCAIDACRARDAVPGAIRIDSGDLEAMARKARQLLNAADCTATRIVVSGDLDEFEIDRLVTAHAPIDSFLVGTRVATGSGHPTASFVYKLVAIEEPDGSMRPVAKASADKATVGGRKRAWRLFDDDGWADSERVTTVSAIAISGAPADRVSVFEDPAVLDPSELLGRPLLRPLLVDGTIIEPPSLDELRTAHLAARNELRPDARLLTPGEPALFGSPS